MKIKAISVYRVNPPFKFTFSHSQKDVRSADNIVEEILPYEQGLAGYGEGGPRPYVTGETQESAIRSVRFLCLNQLFPWDLDDVSQIWNFVGSATGEKNHNSALCALEMAMLDLLARKENRNVLDYLPGDHFTHEVRYGGTVPIADQEMVASICQMLRKFDIRDVRLKMGRDREQNRQALRIVRRVLGPGHDLRVDVNGAWDLDMAKQHLTLLVSYGVSTLEQPLPARDPAWRDLATISKIKDLKLMADESVCSNEDLERAIAEGYFDVINVRLSKCGGFSNSLKMINRIRTAGLRYQVGCQLGESGILSAAGRAMCAISSDALYCDGSYDLFLLRENLTTEHVAFNYGGRAVPLRGPGLGITVNRKNLERFSDYFITIQRP
jgi:L-alanine-DL-glutamate epimerase-like enolase superfamily enzyme